MALRQLCIISLVLFSSLSFCAEKNWNLKAPPTLAGHLGSCVVIPCTFEYKKCSNEKSHPEKGSWEKDGDKIFNTNPSLIIPAFKDRTELLGNVANKSCTLKINNLTEQDNGSYVFRVEGYRGKNRDICHYSYLQHPVTLTVVGIQPVITMDEVKVGLPATVTCSVNYSCESSPPKIRWSHEQRGNTETTPKDDGSQWTLTSNLTFQSNKSDLGTKINCSVKYNRMEINETLLLKLGYPPEIKQSSCVNYLCYCVVEYSPPTTIQWILPNETRSVSTYTDGHEVNVTLNLSDVDWRGGAVQCHARNQYGSATRSFSLGVPILYIIISVFGAVILFFLALIVLVWRYRNLQKKKNDCIMMNPLYKMTEQGEQQSYRTETRKKSAVATRRPAPPIPEMSTANSNQTGGDYIFPVPMKL